MVTGTADKVFAVYRAPFAIKPDVVYQPAGLSLAQMMARMPDLPADFAARGAICINGHEVPRRAWGRVRPHARRNGRPIEITFHAAPQGGDEGGKNPLATIATIALMVAAIYITGGGAAGAFGTSLFAAGSFSANVLAAGVTFAGSLIINALSPPPSPASSPLQATSGAEARRDASIRGNVLEPNGAVPRVVGSMRIFPPFLAEPFTYFDGPDEVTEAVYGLAGPHAITSLRSGGAPLDELAGVDYETREGWAGQEALSLVTRYARTDQVRSELRGHLTEAGSGSKLDVSDGLALALPQPYVAATRAAPDEHRLDLVWTQGMSKNADDTIPIRMPFRLRIRERGESTWIDLPELHYVATSLRPLRATIRLIWTDDPDVTVEAPSTEGWLEARILSPGQSLAPATSDWEADAYFDDGAGTDYVDQNTVGSTAVRRVQLTRYEARIYLDRATFTPGTYEVEIKRGAAFDSSSYDPAAYTPSGSVRDLFGYSGSYNAPASKSGLADQVYLMRSASVWNAAPVTTDAFALIAVRARNRNLEQISCNAAGYVKDWNGSAWASWTTTSNPAPHLRDIFTGSVNLDPVPDAVMGDDDLVAWRTACASAGYECNASFAGGSVSEAAMVVASCGYGRPRMSDEWGIVRDYDRSAEAPVQIFTPRNSRGFSWVKDLPRLPDGFRVNFFDEDNDFEPRQITVFREGLSDDTGRTEQITYEGITSEAAAIARATFDLAQLTARGTKTTIEAPAEALVCRRGSLVGVEHDSLTSFMGSARVTYWTENEAGNVTSIELDAVVDLVNEVPLDEVTDLTAIDNMLLIGATSGAAIRRADGNGVTIHALANTTGSSAVLTFAEAIAPAGIDENILVTVGTIERTYDRMIVANMTMHPNLEATLTLVDEGEELWAA